LAHVQWITESTERGTNVSNAVGADPFAWLGVTLPSETSASAFVSGESGSLVALLLHYLGRATIIGAALAIAGARGADLVKMSAAGAGAIELFLLGESLFKSSPLPTGENATDVIQGVSGAVPKAVAYTLARSLLIAAGLAAVGVRGSELVKYSLAGSAAVEAFVLSYAWSEERKK